MRFRQGIGVNFDIPFANRTDQFDATTKTDEPYNLAVGILGSCVFANIIAAGVLLAFELQIAALVVGCIGGACLVGAIICASIASYKRNIEITNRTNNINNRMMNMQQQYLNNISQPYNNQFITPQEDNIQRKFIQQTPGFNGNNNQINIQHRQMNNDQNNNFNLNSSNNINNSNNMIGGGN